MDSPAAPLSPRGALEIVDAAAELLRRRPRDIVAVVVVSVVPVVLFALLDGIEASDSSQPDRNSLAALTSDQGDVDWTLVLVQLGVSSLLFSFVAYAMTRLVVAEVLGADLRPGAALRAAFGRTPALVGLWVLVHLAQLAGLLALGVGLVVAMCGLMVTVPVLAAEPGVGVRDAFRRSWRLTRGARGHVFAVLLVLLVLNALLGIVLVLGPVSLADVVLDGWPLIVVSAGVEAVADVIVESIVAVATVLTYLDLRVRREGLDIELRMVES